MHSKALLSALLTSAASAKPLLSLPPLIPSIPGVTEPLSTNAPPLPILQVPTPPLDSPPFVSNQQIKPKKIGYFWTAAGDNNHKDFLATYSLDDDTFGTLLWITDVPSSGNSPHHLGPSADGKTLVGGGLLSLLKTQACQYRFISLLTMLTATRTLRTTSIPLTRINRSLRSRTVLFSHPSLMRFALSPMAAFSSPIWAVSVLISASHDGTDLDTAAVGTSPGRLVETDANFNIIHEWPEDVESTLNILGEQFSPHGLSIDFNKKIILTSDFVVPVTILKPASALGIKKANTLRLWDLDSRKILSTITIPNGAGIQDVKFIPGNPESAALATAVGPGQVWIIYPFRTGPNGKKGVAELLFDLGPRARDNLAIYSDISDDGKLAYFTLTLGNHVAALDISDLSNVKRLDDPNANQGIIGPHYVKISPDKKHLLVTDYFVQTGEIGVVNTPADFKAQWIDINTDGSLSFNKSIDFQNEFSLNGKGGNRGGAKPHSAVIFDLTDPQNPKYY